MFSKSSLSVFILLLMIENISTNTGREFKPQILTERSLNTNESGTKYLLGIYNYLNEKDDENFRPKRSTSDKQSLEEEKVITESDSIIVLNNIGSEESEQVSFNASEYFSMGTNIVEARLKMFQDEKKSMINATGNYTVTLHQQITNKSGNISKCSSQKTSASFTGWLSFNITSCFPVWTTSTNGNPSIFLSIHPEHETGKKISAKDLGLVFSNEEAEKRPFWVIFLKSGKQLKIKSTFTRKVILPSVPKNENSTDCRRRDFYVDFSKIGWNDWIIAPGGFDAFRCVGDCSSSSKASKSNHARIQAFVHALRPEDVPKPCCVPTKLVPLTILYVSEDRNVILKNSEDMVVEECGCR